MLQLIGGGEKQGVGVNARERHVPEKMECSWFRPEHHPCSFQDKPEIHTDLVYYGHFLHTMRFFPSFPFNQCRRNPLSRTRRPHRRRHTRYPNSLLMNR